ncbi:hypothetical protein PVAP13_6NG087903 [Panicum virgatum]|uniref:Uncharacterized protein n=1 Tax=Panicum virgatum TaxID=38727 RepID=A0A8T0QVL7_PANVG|nr:hypothetical protein PVAP13_6NG087903 [Panicum virgatum]
MNTHKIQCYVASDDGSPSVSATDAWPSSRAGLQRRELAGDEIPRPCFTARSRRRAACGPRRVSDRPVAAPGECRRSQLRRPRLRRRRRRRRPRRDAMSVSS